MYAASWQLHHFITICSVGTDLLNNTITLQPRLHPKRRQDFFTTPAVSEEPHPI